MHMIHFALPYPFLCKCVWSLMVSHIKHTHSLPFVLSIVRTLGEAWAQLKKSLADEAEVHLKFSSKVFTTFHFISN